MTMSWSGRMLRGLGSVAVLGAVLVGLTLAPSAVGAEPREMAIIETRATLEEDSEEGVNGALRKALEKAIRGAAAMGLERVQVKGAYRGPGFVMVQILAISEADESAMNDGRPFRPAGRIGTR
jgi:hypothetical protein